VTAVSTTAISVDSNKRIIDFYGFCSGELLNFDIISPKPSPDVFNYLFFSNIIYNPVFILAKRYGSSSFKRIYNSTATDVTEQDERRNAKRFTPASKGGF